MRDLHKTLAWVNKAVRANRHEEVRTYCREALENGIVSREIYSYVAGVALQSKHNKEAAEYLEVLIGLGCEDAGCFVNLGIAYYRLSRLDKAHKYLAEALRRSPGLPQAHYNLALVEADTGHLEEAKHHLARAIDHRPDYIRAHQKLASLLFRQAEYAQCIGVLKSALRINPQDYELLLSYGIACRKANSHQESVGSLKRAVNISPIRQDAYLELGIGYLEIQDKDRALYWLRMGLAQGAAEDYDLLMNLTLTLLRLGDYRFGFPHFEKRLQLRPSLLHQPSLLEAGYQWGGTTDTIDELIIVTEQGYGDIFQFLRYAVILTGHVGRISIVAEQKLYGLLEKSHLFDRVYSLPLEIDVLGPRVKWVSILSLPSILQVTPEDVLVHAPYLSAERTKVEHWLPRIKPDASRYVVGIHWQGNPKHEHGDLQGRSFPLEVFRPLKEFDELALVSLQKGEGSEQLATCSFRDHFVQCQNLVDRAWDFVETMAIIECCDLVISSDSAVVHLAGALGKTTWLLLSETGEWRWGTDAAKTHWYENMRLFRQTTPGDWQDVMTQVTAALAESLQECRAEK